jgi:hypothetical protein
MDEVDGGTTGMSYLTFVLNFGAASLPLGSLH